MDAGFFVFSYYKTQKPLYITLNCRLIIQIR